MAFVTRSLVSRTATSGSTGARHRSRAARTWRRASATMAGRAVSRTGSPGSSVGRGGAIVVMGRSFGGGRSGKASAARTRRAPVPVARQMLLQVAVRDIGQLTYIGPAGRAVRFGAFGGRRPIRRCYVRILRMLGDNDHGGATE